MKKWLAILLVMVMLISSAAIGASAFSLKTDDGQISAGDIFGEANVYFADATVAKDATVTVDLKVLGNVGFTGLSITVTPDEGLTLTGVANGEGTVATLEGKVVSITAETPVTADVVLAKLTFKATAAGAKTVDLEATGTNGADPIDINGSVCTILVTEGEPTPVKAGDVNGDDKVDTLDLVLFKQLLVGLVDENSPSVVNPNVDGDAEGRVDTQDLVHLKKLLAGLI